MFALLRVLHTIARAQCSSAVGVCYCRCYCCCWFFFQQSLVFANKSYSRCYFDCRSNKKIVYIKQRRVLHFRAIAWSFSLSLSHPFFASLSRGIYPFAICFMLCVVAAVAAATAVIFYFQRVHENLEDDFAQTILSILVCCLCSTSTKFDAFMYVCASVLLFYS